MNGCIDIIIAWKNYLAIYFKNMQSKNKQPVYKQF